MDKHEAALAIYKEMIRVNDLVRRGTALSDITNSDETLLRRAKVYMEHGSKAAFPHYVLRYYKRLGTPPKVEAIPEPIPFKEFNIDSSIVCRQDEYNIIFLKFPWLVDKETQAKLRGYPFFMKLNLYANQWWRKNTGDIDDNWCELLAKVARSARRIVHQED